MRNSIIGMVVFQLMLHTSVYSQDLIQVNVAVTASDVTARMHEKRTLSNEPCALVMVTTNVADLQFDSDNGIVEVIPSEDGYWVYIGPGETNISVMALGYPFKNITLPEPAREYLVYKMNISTTGEPLLASNLNRMVFRLNEGNIYIQQGDKTPVLSESNIAVFYLHAGSQRFRFIKEGFAETEIIVDPAEDNIIDIQLVPGGSRTLISGNSGVVINSSPVNAEILLNGLLVGTTPYQGTHMEGKFDLALKSDGYHVYQSVIELKQGEINNLAVIELKPLSGFWQVVTEPAGSEVFLNNSFVGTSPLKRSLLREGSYDLQVKRTLYHDHREHFTMNFGDDKLFAITLDEAFGTLSVTSEPPAAAIFIDGQIQAETTPANLYLPEGNYSLTLRKEDFPVVSEEVNIRNKIHQSIDFDMLSFRNNLNDKFWQYRGAKVRFGLSALAAAGAGAYFHYSSMQLAREYPSATTDAGTIYDRMENHQLFSYVAYGAAIPLGILTIIKSSQQKKIRNQLHFSVSPINDGVLLGTAWNF